MNEAETLLVVLLIYLGVAGIVFYKIVKNESKKNDQKIWDFCLMYNNIPFCMRKHREWYIWANDLALETR